MWSKVFLIFLSHLLALPAFSAPGRPAIVVDKKYFAKEVAARILQISCHNPQGYLQSCYAIEPKDCVEKLKPLLRKSANEVLRKISKDKIEITLEGEPLAQEIGRLAGLEFARTQSRFRIKAERCHNREEFLE